MPDSEEQVLVVVETKSQKEIMEHVKKIWGKKEETLREEELEKQQQSHSASLAPPPSLVLLAGMPRGKWKVRYAALAWCLL